jgi:hypothetical protein
VTRAALPIDDFQSFAGKDSARSHDALSQFRPDSETVSPIAEQPNPVVRHVVALSLLQINALRR